MAKELDDLLYEIQKRGNCITTYDLRKVGRCQYQRALKDLRERLAEKGIILTKAEKITGQKGNNLYRMILPEPVQKDMFEEKDYRK